MPKRIKYIKTIGGDNFYIKLRNKKVRINTDLIKDPDFFKDPNVVTEPDGLNDPYLFKYTTYIIGILVMIAILFFSTSYI
jgi:hypothetical protein